MEEQTKKIKEHNIDEKTTETFRKELKDINDKLNKIDIDEFTFDDWYSKGTNEYYNGDKNKAIKYFEKSIRLETNDTNLSKAFFFMGYIYKDELKDNENAIKYYKMSIEKEHVDAMYNLALLYEQELKDNENAEKYYKMYEEYKNAEENE